MMPIVFSFFFNYSSVAQQGLVIKQVLTDPKLQFLSNKVIEFEFSLSCTRTNARARAHTHTHTHTQYER